MRGLDPCIHLLGKKYGKDAISDCEEWMDPRVKPAGDIRGGEVMNQTNWKTL
jgi:hypothetical protein